MSIIYSKEIQFLLETGKISTEDAENATQANPPLLLVNAADFIHTLLCIHTAECKYYAEKNWSDDAKRKWLLLATKILAEAEIDTPEKFFKLQDIMICITQICGRNRNLLKVAQMCVDIEVRRAELYAQYIPSKFEEDESLA